MELEATIPGYSDHSVEEYQVEKEPTQKGSSDARQPAASGCFDCSICLDFAVDPVVTLCGHLYCWPCIYKWLQVETGVPQQCPICKAPLSQNTLIPLYGRGPSTKEGSQRSVKIPNRPSVHKDHALLASMIQHQSSSDSEEEYFEMLAPMQQSQLDQHHQQQNHHPHYGSSSPDGTYVSDPSLLFAAPVFHSTAGGLLGGMAVAILPWLSGNHGAELNFASPYCLTMSENNPRLRRQEMLVESSLHQLWLFLFCCAVLCLVFF